MITIIGSFLLIAASTMLGISKSNALKTKAHILSSLISALEQIKGELITLHMPIAELAQKLSNEAPVEIQPFFCILHKNLNRLGDESFADIWTASVLQSSQLHLTQEEQNTLCLLGLSLGRYELETQETVLNQVITRFTGFYNEARDAARVQGRVYTGLGVAAGLMLSVVLI